MARDNQRFQRQLAQAQQQGESSLNWTRSADGQRFYLELEIGGSWEEPLTVHYTDLFELLGEQLTEKLFETMKQPQGIIYGEDNDGGPTVGWSLEL